MTAVKLSFSPRRRRPAFTVEYDGTVVLLLPEKFPQRGIPELIEHNAELIARLRRDYEKTRRDLAPPPEFRLGARFRFQGDPYPVALTSTGRTGFDGAQFLVSGDHPAVIRRDLVRIYRKLAREVIEYKTRKLALRHGIVYNELKINAASTRWGSCSAEGNLNFSWKLVMVPEALIEYVIAHELAHRRELNHSPAFWREVEKLCPRYRVWRKLLRQEVANTHPHLWEGEIRAGAGGSRSGC